MTYDDIVSDCTQSNVQLIRFLYCDYSGVARGKTIHVRHLAHKLHEGIGLTRAQMAINLLEELTDVRGMEPVGEIRLVPDANTFSILPWDRRSASMYCDQIDHDREAWGGCPRTFLKQAVNEAAQYGMAIEATFENEFYLAREVDGVRVPFDHAPVYSSIGLDLSAAVMHDIVDALEAQGLEVEQAINEYGPGQMEISIRHKDALAAADRQMRLRDTARGIALKHGLLASFAPKPFPDGIGSGCHIHFSLWNPERTQSLLYDPDRPVQLSDTGRHFIAGVLRHLRALTALTCPSYNSYSRLQPHAWSSAYTAWGFDNREAAVRIASPFWGRESDTYNLELKTSDASANPYLSLGGLIWAGIDGVRNGWEPGPPVSVDPGKLSDSERQSLGIVELPKSMAEALAALENDRVLIDAMGDLMARAYLTVRRAEERVFREQNQEFEIANHFYKF